MSSGRRSNKKTSSRSGSRSSRDYSSDEESTTTRRSGVRRLTAKTELNFIEGMNAYALEQLFIAICDTLEKHYDYEVDPVELAKKTPVIATGKKSTTRAVSDKPEPTTGCERIIKSSGRRCGNKPDEEEGQGRLCRRCYNTKDGKERLGLPADTPNTKSKTGPKPNPNQGKNLFTRTGSAAESSVPSKSLVKLPIDGDTFIYMAKKTPGILIYKSGNKHFYLGKLNSKLDEIIPLDDSDKRIDGTEKNVYGSSTRIKNTEKILKTKDRDALEKVINDNWEEWQDDKPEDNHKSKKSSKRDSHSPDRRSKKRDDSRSPSPAKRRSERSARKDSRSPSPAKRRSKKRDDSRSPSPAKKSRDSRSPKRRERKKEQSRSPSPVKRRSERSSRKDSRSPSPVKSKSRSPSPVKRRSERSSRKDSRSPSPKRDSRSPSPMKRRSERSEKRDSSSPALRRSERLAAKKDSRSPSPKKDSRSPSPKKKSRSESSEKKDSRSPSPKRRSKIPEPSEDKLDTSNKSEGSDNFSDIDELQAEATRKDDNSSGDE